MDVYARARMGRKHAATSQTGMVITSHPMASHIGADVLRAGGNAVDAALAAATAQLVLEPHMTTITGMCSLLYRDAAGATSYLNGSINAPLEMPDSFGQKALRTGKGVAVPGYWAGWESAYARFATKPRAELMAPAIALARDGFPVHPFLFGEMFEHAATIGVSEQGREVFMPDGALLAPGQTLRQPRLARTLEQLRDEGIDYAYRGEFAHALVETVRRAGGTLTRGDLERYQVRWMEPAHGTYRGYDVIASPPPDNGGTHVIESLNMIELLDLAKLGPPTESAETLYQMMRIVEETKVEGGKQNDPASHPLPLEVILSKQWAAMRFELLQMSAPREPQASTNPGSNHISVVDAHGNIASLLHSSLATPFVNGLFCEGFSVSAAAGHFARTRPKPGMRASVYCAPTIVLKDGRPVLTSGSPSVSLVQNVVQNTVNILDFGLDIETSVHRPRFGSTTEHGHLIEADIDESLRDDVAARGLKLDVVAPWFWLNGSFEGIAIAENATLSACGDPRRAGQAEGL